MLLSRVLAESITHGSILLVLFHHLVDYTKIKYFCFREVTIIKHLPTDVNLAAVVIAKNMTFDIKLNVVKVDF